MCSRCLHRESIAAVLGALLLVAMSACKREQRDLDPRVVPAAAEGTAISKLDPGRDGPPVATAPDGTQYEGIAYQINEGQRLYNWFNCNGCHGNGGGNIGPALMDDEWRYGGSMAQIHASIVQGRPNGMPTFRDRIPDAQIWQIAAYVRALSGNVPKSAAPSRGETISAMPPLTRVPAQPPKDSDSSSGEQPQP